MNTQPFAETLFVRADRLCLGDTVVFEAGTVAEKRVPVTSLELVGDDVLVTGGYGWTRDNFETSQGNVLRVERRVMPTDVNRYMG